MRWRRSSWRSPIYTGWPLPAVSLRGGGVHIVLAARVPERGEKGGRRGSKWGGVFLSSRGGQARGERRWRPWWGAAMAPVASLSPQGKVMTSGAPLSGFFSFLFPFLFPAVFRDLFEASNHFLKFCKNSSGLHFTFRAYTKIGGPK